MAAPLGLAASSAQHCRHQAKPSYATWSRLVKAPIRLM